MMLDSSTRLAGGHRWRRCSACGGWAATLEDGACRNCPSVRKRNAQGEEVCSRPRTRAQAVDQDAQTPTATREGREPCQRPGCGNAGAWQTALGELVCRRCLAALAEYDCPSVT